MDYKWKQSTEKLEDELIKSGDIHEIGICAYYVPGANIERLEAATIEIGTAEEIGWFAENIKGANTEKLQDALNNLKN